MAAFGLLAAALMGVVAGFCDYWNRQKNQPHLRPIPITTVDTTPLHSLTGFECRRQSLSARGGAQSEMIEISNAHASSLDFARIQTVHLCNRERAALFPG
jgi:hypothetical protein